MQIDGQSTNSSIGEGNMAMASRPAEQGLFGKNTERVTADVSEETKGLLDMLAVAEGETRAAYIRGVLEEHVHGKGSLLRVRLSRSNGSNGNRR